MKVQTGVDIIEVDRIKEAIEKQGENFLQRVYTQKEIEYCNNTGKMKYQHYAARFAAKEAVFKAISSKLPKGTGDIWKNIEVEKNADGKPFVNLNNINLNNIDCMDLSLSHLKDYAIANFVVIFKD